MKPHQWRRSRIGKYLRHLPRIKHVKGTWLHRKLGDQLFKTEAWQPDRQRIAAGAAIGAFIGMIPIPVQMISAAFLAFITRVNIPSAIAFTWLTNPFTAPFFIYAQYKIGMFCLGLHSAEPRGSWLDILKHAPLPVLVGSVVFGLMISIISYPLCLWGYDIVTKYFLHPSARKSFLKKKTPEVDAE